MKYLVSKMAGSIDTHTEASGAGVPVKGVPTMSTAA